MDGTKAQERKIVCERTGYQQIVQPIRGQLCILCFAAALNE